MVIVVAVNKRHIITLMIYTKVKDILDVKIHHHIRCSRVVVCDVSLLVQGLFTETLLT